MHLLLLGDVGELCLEAAYSVEDDAAVGLDLGLAGAAHADAASLALQVGPHSCQAGQQVLVLRQLHLGAGGGRLGALGEYVEDEAGSVEHLHLQLLLYVGHLLGAELVVEDNQRDLVLLDVCLELFELALADVCARVGVVEALCHAADGLSPGGVG